jgi:hypothetical protein
MNFKVCSLLSFLLSIFAGGCFLPVMTQAQESSSGPTVKVRLIDSNGMLTEPTVVPKVQKTDAEWRKQLTAEEYAIARGQGDRTCVLRHAARQPSPGDLPLCVLRPTALCVGLEIRFGNRLAQFLPAGGKRECRLQGR